MFKTFLFAERDWGDSHLGIRRRITDEEDLREHFNNFELPSDALGINYVPDIRRPIPINDGMIDPYYLFTNSRGILEFSNKLENNEAFTQRMKELGVVPQLYMSLYSLKVKAKIPIEENIDGTKG